MKITLTLLMAAAMLLAGASMGLAEDAKTDKKADAPTQAKLQVQMHRAMAALVEARSAEKPDEAKIEKLADKVQALRSQMWAQRDTRGLQAGQQRPWGGPRSDRQMGRGYGPGKGYGAQQGRGRGQGRGMGAVGRGQGRGMGYGMDRAVGRSQGRGMGYCMGRGQGCGMGYGMDRAVGRGQGRGMGYGMGGQGRGQGRGMATGMGRGLGRQWDYVDKNQDGICDNAMPPAPAKSAQPEK